MPPFRSSAATRHRGRAFCGMPQPVFIPPLTWSAPSSPQFVVHRGDTYLCKKCYARFRVCVPCPAVRCHVFCVFVLFVFLTKYRTAEVFRLIVLINNSDSGARVGQSLCSTVPFFTRRVHVSPFGIEISPCTCEIRVTGIAIVCRRRDDSRLRPPAPETGESSSSDE